MANGNHYKAVVCHISFSEYPADGRIKRYVNALTRNNYSVIVLCIKDPFHPSTEKSENLLIKRLHVSKKRGNYISRTLEYLFFFLKSSYFALFYFLKYRIKVFHTHTLPDFISLSVMIPRIFGAKVILDLHEFTPEILVLRRHIPDNHWLVKFARMVEKISVFFADELITIHEGVAELIGKRNRREITPIINGVEKDEFAGFERIKTDDFNIVYNGTINDSINLEDVIYALDLIRKKIPEPEFRKIKFYLFGKGPVLKFLLDEAGKHDLSETVIYRGKVPYEKMIDELRKMSVCVLPLHRTIGADLSYPIKIPEMVNLRIPLIISRLNTSLRFFNEECFFYFDSADVNDLAGQILLVKNNGVLAEKKVKNALNAYDKISWDSIMKPRYLNIIQKLLTGRE